MASSVIGIIFEIIFSIINSSTSLLWRLFALVMELAGKIALLSSMGMAGLLAGFIALAFVVFILWKFVFGSVKHVIILFIIGTVLLLLVFAFA